MARFIKGDKIKPLVVLEEDMVEQEVDGMAAITISKDKYPNLCGHLYVSFGGMILTRQLGDQDDESGMYGVTYHYPYPQEEGEPSNKMLTYSISYTIMDGGEDGYYLCLPAITTTFVTDSTDEYLSSIELSRAATYEGYEVSEDIKNTFNNNMGIQEQLTELSEESRMATAMLDLAKLIIPNEYYNQDGSVAISTSGTYNRLPIIKVGASRVVQVAGFSDVTMTIRCLNASKEVIDSPYFSLGNEPQVKDIELPESTEFIAIYFKSYKIYDGAYICTKDSAYYSNIKKQNDLAIAVESSYANLSALLNLQSIIVKGEYYNPNGTIGVSANYNRLPIIKVNSLDLRIVGIVNISGDIRCMNESYSVIDSINLNSSDTERNITLPTGTCYIAIYFSSKKDIPVGAYIAAKDSYIELLDGRIQDVEDRLETIGGQTRRDVSLEVWKDGKYVSYESSYLTSNSAYDVTQPIFLRKGEILVYKSLCQPHVAEVAKVLDHLLATPIYIPLVAGRNTYQTENQYIVEEDGYYVLSVRDAEQYPAYVTTAYVIEPDTKTRIENLENEVAEIKKESGQNTHDMLFGKKYVACGDSFTAGTTEVFEEGIYKGRDKTYPYLIGLRTGMEVVNMAVGGMSMVQSGDSSNYFSGDYFKGIPLDADYITIKLGINDTNYGSPIGTINDTTNETFYGAWNVVMEHLIVNYPYAKIGIIVTNGANNEVMEAEREIAKKWGVPFLDYADPQTPLMGRMSGMRNGVSSVAINARHNAFRTSETDSHPNAKAHEYESTFIEAFLRRL